MGDGAALLAAGSSWKARVLTRILVRGLISLIAQPKETGLFATAHS